MTAKNRAVLIIALAILAIIGGTSVWLRLHGSFDPTSARFTVTTHKASPPAFNKQQFSTADPASIWVVVNKQHPLSPRNYVPASLVVPNVPLRSNITADERQVSAAMAPALEQLVAAAKRAGLTINLQSGYRSYNTQVGLYGSYVRQSGQAAADRFSARPGFSEHQTGLAADLGGISNPACNVQECFGQTPEGKWLAAHAYQFGFIIRYPSTKESVTGYEDEPWHVRYVGTALATEMHDEHILTLEEFFGVSGGTTYLQ